MSKQETKGMQFDYDRAELGVDGNAAYALLGDLPTGEVEFVTISAPGDLEQILIATKTALRRLRERLGRPDLNYYFGKSHPYGRD